MMKGFLTTIFSAFMLAGCAATSSSDDALFRLVEIVPGCKVLHDQAGLIRRPGPKWHYTYAAGNCPAAIREQQLALAKVDSIVVDGHVARISAVHPKFGPYKLTMRKSGFIYGKGRYSFSAYWPNGNPFLR